MRHQLQNHTRVRTSPGGRQSHSCLHRVETHVKALAHLPYLKESGMNRDTIVQLATAGVRKCAGTSANWRWRQKRRLACPLPGAGRGMQDVTLLELPHKVGQRMKEGVLMFLVCTVLYHHLRNLRTTLVYRTALRLGLQTYTGRAAETEVAQ